MLQLHIFFSKTQAHLRNITSGQKAVSVNSRGLRIYLVRSLLNYLVLITEYSAELKQQGLTRRKSDQIVSSVFHKAAPSTVSEALPLTIAEHARH